MYFDCVFYMIFGYLVDYGYFDNMFGEDGDLFDVFVLFDYVIYLGVVVEVCFVVVLKMSDEVGGDDKFVVVFLKDLWWVYI